MFDKIDTYIVLGKENRYYYTKIDTSSGILILNEKERIFITDFRYEIEARSKLPDYNVISVGKGKQFETVLSELKRIKAKTIGFEDDVLTFREHKDLKATLDNYTLKAAGGVFKEARAIKTAEEVANITQAQRIAEKALHKVRPQIKAGVTEREIAAALVYEMLKGGAEGLSFDPIVAAGAHAAKPHHHPSDKKIEKGECVLLDFGCKYNGYCSDMTRTFFVGEPTKQMESIYKIVLEAQKYAISKIKPGITGNEADSFAREYISSNGYDKEFGHSLGHGVGLYIHELPNLSKDNPEVLKTGMVITVEPGVYIEDVGGVRIEDMILLTEEGNINLTNFEKEFDKL